MVCSVDRSRKGKIGSQSCCQCADEHVPGTLRPSASWNLTENPSRIALAQPNVLRQLRRGQALLIHSNLPAADVKALPRS